MVHSPPHTTPPPAFPLPSLCLCLLAITSSLLPGWVLPAFTHLGGGGGCVCQEEIAFGLGLHRTWPALWLLPSVYVVRYTPLFHPWIPCKPLPQLWWSPAATTTTYLGGGGPVPDCLALFCRPCPYRPHYFAVPSPSFPLLSLPYLIVYSLLHCTFPIAMWFPVGGGGCLFPVDSEADLPPMQTFPAHCLPVCGGRDMNCLGGGGCVAARSAFLPCLVPFCPCRRSSTCHCPCLLPLADCHTCSALVPMPPIGLCCPCLPPTLARCIAYV